MALPSVKEAAAILQEKFFTGKKYKITDIDTGTLVAAVQYGNESWNLFGGRGQVYVAFYLSQTKDSQTKDYWFPLRFRDKPNIKIIKKNTVLYLRAKQTNPLKDNPTFFSDDPRFDFDSVSPPTGYVDLICKVTKPVKVLYFDQWKDSILYSAATVNHIENVLYHTCLEYKCNGWKVASYSDQPTSVKKKLGDKWDAKYVMHEIAIIDPSKYVKYVESGRILIISPDSNTLNDAVQTVHNDSVLNTVMLREGIYDIEGAYLNIWSTMNIVGDPNVSRDKIVINGGIRFNKMIPGICHLQHLSLCKARWCGVDVESSLTMDDVLVESCRFVGIYASGTVGRCTNVEVRYCEGDGVVAADGASITLVKTDVHHNCKKKGVSTSYGLKVIGPTATIDLVFPLTKEEVSHDNDGGNNWGAFEADINQIKRVYWLSDKRSLSDELFKLKNYNEVEAANPDISTIVLGKGKHTVYESHLRIPYDIVGDRMFPRNEIVVMGGLAFSGNCRLQHLTIENKKGTGVMLIPSSVLTAEDVVIHKCLTNGVAFSRATLICKNVEVSHCGHSGMVLDGALLTLEGKTKVHNNCTKGHHYGLQVNNGTVRLLDGLTLETVFYDNGDHNWNTGATQALEGAVYEIKSEENANKYKCNRLRF